MTRQQGQVTAGSADDGRLDSPGVRARTRRLRSSAALRDLAAEVRLDARDLIVPHFVVSGSGRKESIPGMPGVTRMSPDRIVDAVREDLDSGLMTHLFFGMGDRKDAEGSAASDPQGPVPVALRALREEVGDRANLLTDVCLCAYTDHGHCGVLEDPGRVDNDATLPLLARMAVVHAQAGADLVCPSDMMDGRVAAIREALDQAGESTTGILSYSAKFASVFYGPFRDAAGSAPGEGDRRGYQMDPRNGREAVREALLDVSEGADAVMVKPALAYLDVIRAVREATRLPVACYNVSGEYALVQTGAREGLFEEKEAVRETLWSMKRAGADWIISYHARRAVQQGWLA